MPWGFVFLSPLGRRLLPRRPPVALRHPPGTPTAPRAEELPRLLAVLEQLPERLPDPKTRLIARKVLEYGAPIPWKQIVAELGYRWTVGKARYAYSRVCALCFSAQERGRTG